MDIDIKVPVAGVFEWMELGKGFDRGEINQLTESLVWDARCVEDSGTETHDFVNSVKTSLTPAAEYMVWMKYPVQNGKVPWGLIANHVTPEAAQLFLKGMVQKLNIQPR